MLKGGRFTAVHYGLCALVAVFYSVLLVSASIALRRLSPLTAFEATRIFVLQFGYAALACTAMIRWNWNKLKPAVFGVTHSLVFVAFVIIQMLVRRRGAEIPMALALGIALFVPSTFLAAISFGVQNAVERARRSAAR